MTAMVPTTTPIVSVRHLRHLSLAGVDLDIAEGERVVIIGESGAGKSVLLRCLLGLERPRRGRCVVLGAEVRARALRLDGVGVAFQQPGLFDAWSVARNLQLASSEPLGEDAIRGWLAAVGLVDVDPAAAPGLLSGGQQKRVALARAMLRGTRLLVLDEPTSGLDPASAQQAVRLLREHVEHHRTTLLLITHDHDVAHELGTRTLRLAQGRLSEVVSTSAPDLLDGAGAVPAPAGDGPGASVETASGPPLVRRPAPRRGPIVLEFLSVGLPLSIATMILLGAMLVAESAGTSPIDVSRFVPHVVVVAVFREFAPLVVGLILAGRTGTRIAAEIGGMSYTAQLDSMRVLGLSPLRLLLVPFATAGAVSFPVCILAGAVFAVLAGAIVAALPASGLSIGTTRFLSLGTDAFGVTLVLSGLVKGLLMGATVASVAYWSGTRRTASATALGGVVTRATVAGAIAIVLIDVVVSWLFFAGGAR